MARTTGRSGFKMKSGNAPLRQDNDARSIKRAQLTSDINSFFSGLGKSVSDAASKIGTQLKKGQKERGIFSEYGKAKKKEARTPKWKREYDARKTAETIVDEPIVVETDLPKVPAEPKSKGEYYTFSGKKGDKYKYRLVTDYGASDDDRYEFQRPGSDIWETSKTKAGTRAIQNLFIQDYEGRDVEITPIQKKSPTKRSGFKMKNSPAKIYSKPKGKRTEY